MKTSTELVNDLIATMHMPIAEGRKEAQSILDELELATVRETLQSMEVTLQHLAGLPAVLAKVELSAGLASLRQSIECTVKYRFNLK